MNAVMGALQSGFTSKQIVDFLLKKFPKHAEKINTAVAMGFTPNQIIKFLSGGRQSLNSPEEIEPMTEHQMIGQREQQRTQNINKTALGLALAGGSALGAYALGRALPAAAQQLAPGLLAGTPGPTPSQSSTPIPQQTPIQANPTPQPTLQAPAINPLQNHPIKTKVDQLIAARNTPKEIVPYLRSFNKKEVADLEKSTGKPIEETVSDYFQNAPKPQETPKITEPGQETLQQIKPLEEPKEKEIAPVQSKTVILSNGDIGEVKNVRNGIAEIDIDGKTKTRKLDEVIQSPISEKDLADLYTDLISGIEKKTGQEVSRNVYWAGYDPKTNELAYVPHNGSLYIYENILPEDAKQLTNILAQRKSTGENFIGAWSEGTKSPIGAEMFKLIQRLQKERGGKGKEYSNKFEKIYDALEAATKAEKEKHKEKQKNEKSKKPKAKKPKFD